MNKLRITAEFLQRHNACEDGYAWWLKNCEGLPDFEQIEKVKNHDLKWCNWLIARLMTKEECVKYAVFAAEPVIDIYEKEYPNDKRPRSAIKAAKKYIENQIEENRKTADAAFAAYAADEAAFAAANAAAYAAFAAAFAAYAAAFAAYAAYAADEAAYTAYATKAVYEAVYAAYAADEDKAAADEMKLKIINYGIELLKKPGLI
jgi:hypothetical protein